MTVKRHYEWGMFPLKGGGREKMYNINDKLITGYEVQRWSMITGFEIAKKQYGTGLKEGKSFVIFTFGDEVEHHLFEAYFA